MNDCIHCGLCLSACPTYTATKRERSGPRGRIALMALDHPKALAEEMDFCLGCLACTSACPAGVDYGGLLEQARAKTVPAWRKWLLRVALGGPRRMRVLRPWPKQRIREIERPGGTPRLRVGMLTGCVQDQWFRGVNRDTVDVLLHHGCEVVTPRNQGCCGALHAHEGDVEFGTKLAERLRSDVDVLVSNSAGCGAHLKRVGLPVKDVHELLAELGIRAAKTTSPTQPGVRRIAYHDACHLAHGQGIRKQPRDLLRAIEGVEVMDVSDTCCGAAGTYFLHQREFARTLLDQKTAELYATRPDVIAAANPGCLLQLRRAVRGVPVLHPITIYARASNLRHKRD